MLITAIQVGIQAVVVLVAAGTTVNRLRSRYSLRGDLRKARDRYTEDRYYDLETSAKWGIEREWARIFKHAVCILGVALLVAFPPPPSFASQIRGWLFVVISLGLMWVSLRDGAVERRLVSRHMRSPNFEPGSRTEECDKMQSFSPTSADGE